jgi:hypothetical protein
MEELIARLAAKLTDDQVDEEIFDSLDMKTAQSRMNLIGRLRQSATVSARNLQLLNTADPSRPFWKDETGKGFGGVRTEDMLEWLAADEIEHLRVALRKACLVMSGEILTKEAITDALETARNVLDLSVGLLANSRQA